MHNFGVANGHNFKNLDYMEFFLVERIILDYKVIQKIVFEPLMYFMCCSRYLDISFIKIEKHNLPCQICMLHERML